MASIVKLPDSTIQLIAAGEVITSPLNVIKELMENSLDAKATNLRLTVNIHKPYSIEIIDNGTGIQKADAALLCKRHATSKLTTADDLTRISSFGFRGEALASISEVAEVYVETFNKDKDLMGWYANYESGNLAAEPKEKYVENVGTFIKVTNLFTKDFTRKKALYSSAFEHRRSIIELVRRYAIHYRETITISLKEILTGKPHQVICSIAPTNFQSSIGSFFGPEMSSNVIDINLKNEENYKLEGTLKLTYRKWVSQQTTNFILFINDRLVDCPSLKKEVEGLVHNHLSQKQHTILIYVALKVPACDIDVNMHPAKSTVALHFQVEIIAMITEKLRKELNETLTSSQALPARSSMSQNPTLLSHLSQPTSSNTSSPNNPEQFTNETKPVPVPARRPHNLIHTDHSQRSLKQFITADQLVKISSPRTMNSAHRSNNPPDPKTESPYNVPPKRKRRELRLKSITDLKQLVANEMADNDSIQLIKNSVFVGLFDHDRALIQHGTKLYAINLKSYLKEQYYQFYLFDFGNFPKIELLPPGNKIKYMIEMYLEDLKKHDRQTFDKLAYDTPESVVEKLLEHSLMLDDYLSMRFTETEIISLPCIIPDEIPNLVHLGKFLTHLANRVDYLDESECFRRIGRLIADFYSNPPANLKDVAVHRSYHETVETKLHVAIKDYLIIPEWLFTKENICQISDTKDLYKVFERC